MTIAPHELRPHTTVVLAMSADGKIADAQRSPARFGSAIDKAHLERQIAQADGVLMGAATLRAYGTTLPVSNPDLLAHRQQLGKSAQPIQIIGSSSGQLNHNYRFFQQPIPRWLVTTPAGAALWQGTSNFDRLLTVDTTARGLDWSHAMLQLYHQGLQRLVIAGGGQLVASLFAAGLVDELWLTVCPLVLGGMQAPTPVEGLGFVAELAPRLTLLSVEAIANEVFLHYAINPQPNPSP